MAITRLPRWLWDCAYKLISKINYMINFSLFHRDLLDKKGLDSPLAFPMLAEATMKLSVPYRGEKDFNLIKASHFFKKVGLNGRVVIKKPLARKRFKVLIFSNTLRGHLAVKFTLKLINEHAPSIIRRDGIYTIDLAGNKTVLFNSKNLFDFDFQPKKYDYFGWAHPVFVSVKTGWGPWFFSLCKVYPDNVNIK